MIIKVKITKKYSCEGCIFIGRGGICTGDGADKMKCLLKEHGEYVSYIYIRGLYNLHIL